MAETVDPRVIIKNLRLLVPKTCPVCGSQVIVDEKEITYHCGKFDRCQTLIFLKKLKSVLNIRGMGSVGIKDLFDRLETPDQFQEFIL